MLSKYHALLYRTTINTLINLLFVHKLMALPTPGQEFYKTYKRKVIKFLWGESIPKISYDKLVQDYNKLGLRLVDLESKEIALKAAMALKIYENEVDNNYSWFYDKLLIQNKNVMLAI